MKSWRITRFGSPIVLSDAPEPRLEDGFARVRVSRTSVNHIDRLTMDGRFGWVTLPRTPGSEYVGTVEEISAGMKDVEQGDRVAVFPKMFCGRCRYCTSGQESTCLSGWEPSRSPVDLSTNMLPVSADGGWSETAIIPAKNLVRLPERLSFDGAFGIPLSGTAAWHMVKRARPAPGEKAIVMGSDGGIGISAMQILKMHGVDVLAVTSDMAHARELKRLGADSVSLPDPEIFERGLENFAGNVGADIVIDSLGQSTFQQSFTVLSPGGRYVTCGSLTGAKSELNILRLYSRQLELMGSTTGSRRDMADALQAAAVGRLRIPVDSDFGFEDMPAAVARHHVHGRFGKIRVNVSQ